jgi:hypothetical protein
MNKLGGLRKLRALRMALHDDSCIIDASITVPKDVLEAIDALQNIGRKSRRAHPQQAPLWLFGDAAGRACWHKGYVAGLQELAPAGDEVRLDCSTAELVQLGRSPIWASNIRCPIIAT